MSRTAYTRRWPEALDEADAARPRPVRYLESFHDHWLLIAAIVGAALLAAFLYVSNAQKRYTAHAQIVVTPLPADGTTFLGIGGLIRTSSVAQPVVTAAQLLNGPQVREQTAARLRSRSPVTFDVTPLGQTNVVDIQATASTPREAETAANVYAETALQLRKVALQNELTAAISRLQSRLAVTGGGGANAALTDQITLQLAQLNSLVGSPDPTLALLDRAAEPSSYSWPRPKLSFLVALLCGLVLGAIVAAVVDYLDPAARDSGDLRGANGPEMLVRVPAVRERDLRPYAAGALAKESRYRDGFRRLRSMLTGPGSTQPAPSVVAVCSKARNEGRATTAVGLAKALADSERRVVVVDGDMRRAHATSALCGRFSGLTLPDVLRDVDALPASLVALGPNLWLLPAAADPDGPDQIASGRLDGLLEALRAEFDSVVVDAAPFGDGPDGYAFAEAADAVLLCARLGRTSRRAFSESLQRLESMGVGPVGIVAVGGKAGYGFEHGWWSPDVERSDGAAPFPEPVRSLLPNRRAHHGRPGDDQAAL